MLISFAVTNFRSIKERAVIDLAKTAAKGLVNNYHAKFKLLNSAVLYGANASGKSGFLNAIRALEFLVLNSADFKPGKSIFLYDPFLLDRSCQNAPVVLEVSFLMEKVKYDYKVVYDTLNIVQEELYFYKGNSKALLFYREQNKEIKFGDYYKGAKKTIEKLLLPNQLFLSKAAENNVEALMQAYLFFAEQLDAYPVFDIEMEDDLKNFYAKRLAEDKNGLFTKRFNALICALDTGIQGVTIEETDWNKFRFPNAIPDEVKGRIQERFKYDIKTSHPLFENGEHVGEYTFEVKQESTGTKNLFALAGLIIDSLEYGRVLVVDELEKNLHPNITRFLIQLFHHPELNKNNAQLIFATHDITQLSNDIFRRDQVWFTEKNERGESILFRCSDLEGVRLNTPLDKWYVSGRFGATPIINDVDFLIAMQQEEEVEG
ncbi:ATP-binding protein [Pedobacter aquae]|uniref:ATP-binding protein n=1 Tax=Pedobacter aquae TaxID=2605747 RepID=A0A5C0VN77_9SPHI|nr:ATP-binding protein [Pedobacter aquae]QEK52760.1 ATP-binding protein [Pedobacter aquae]